MKKAPFFLPCLLLASCLGTPQAPTGSPGVGLPTHPWAGASAALQTMAARDAKLTSLRLAGTLKLEESADKSVLLEAILVVKITPNHPPQLRLQAKKLGHTAFDLTLNDQGAWLVDGREDADANNTQAHRGMARMGRGLRQLSGGQVWAHAHLISQTPETFTVSLDNNQQSQATLHKATLVPLTFEFQTPEGPVQLRLEHAPVCADDGGVFALPCKLAALAPKGRKFSFEARKLEANPRLPDAIFNPPKTAVHLSGD